jgi:hypothetical protein
MEIYGNYGRKVIRWIRIKRQGLTTLRYNGMLLMYLSFYYKLTCASKINNARRLGKPSHAIPQIAILSLGTQPWTFRNRNIFRRDSATKFHQTRLVSGLANVGQIKTVVDLPSPNSNNLFAPQKHTPILVPQSWEGPIYQTTIFYWMNITGWATSTVTCFMQPVCSTREGHAYFVRQKSH